MYAKIYVFQIKKIICFLEFWLENDIEVKDYCNESVNKPLRGRISFKHDSAIAIKCDSRVQCSRGQSVKPHKWPLLVPCAGWDLKTVITEPEKKWRIAIFNITNF